MSADWPEFQIGERCTVKSSKRIFAHEYVEDGIPFMRSKDVIDKALGSFVEYDLYISGERFAEIQKTHGSPARGDLLMSSVGNRSGQPYVIQDEGDFHFKDGNILWLSEFEDINSDYLAYWLKSEIGQDALTSVMIGSAQKALTIDSIRKLWVRFPPIEYQDWAAENLLRLDEKIELNRQTNQTLEHIAQAIFKSWFVDFEPTRAKIAAKQTSQDPERAAMAAISGKSLDELDQLSPEQQEQLKTTAALFSDALVDSELGEIPEGWEVKALDEIAHYQNGLALQKFRPENEYDFLPVLKIAQLKKGFADGDEKASPNIKPECIVDNGDVVFSWSGSLLVDVWCGGKVALNQHLFKVTSEGYPKWFYCYWTKHHLEEFQQIAADKAVTMGHIKRSHLSEAKCAVPAYNLDDFTLIADLLEKQIEQRLESSVLEEVRDSLLPKLLSNELSITHIEAE